MIDRLSWIAIAPELLLLVMVCVIAIYDLFLKSPQAVFWCVKAGMSDCLSASLRAAW